jgi:hypothetical protein
MTAVCVRKIEKIHKKLAKVLAKKKLILPTHQ